MTIGGKRLNQGNSSRKGLSNNRLLRAPGMGYSDANPDKKAGLSVTVEENV
jgi:hypothetical protein